MNNIRKLGSRFDNPLVNGACFHFFAINSSTSDFLTMKSTRQMTLIPLSIKKWIRLKCRNCRDMLELGVVQWQLILFPIRFTCFVTPLMLSKFRLRLPGHSVVLAFWYLNPVSLVWTLIFVFHAIYPPSVQTQHPILFGSITLNTKQSSIPSTLNLVWAVFQQRRLSAKFGY